MAEALFRAIPIEYEGLYAIDHLMDIQELGVSLQGLGKLTNGIVHFYLHGQIARDSRLHLARLFAGPPKEGSILYDLLALMVAGQLPLYAPLLLDMAEQFIPRMFRAVVSLAIGRRAEMERIIDKVAELAQAHAEFSKAVHDGHMRDKAWMQDHIAKLTDQSHAPLKELVRPIGTSCRQIKLGDEKITEPMVVDEPEAEVLSSKDNLEVGDMRQFRGTFEAVDTTNGTCKVRIEGGDDVLRGKITDPALMNVQNVYTHSLDTKQPISISAKPVTKEGEIVRLFVSDGKPITDVISIP